MLIAGIIIIGITALLLGYIYIVRPRQLVWGATKSEAGASLLGDEIVAHPDFVATRGISIAASKENIWKWIVQIGSKRAGWYSIDLIDNGGKKSATVILPEFQSIETGQFIPFTPDGKNGMWVEEFYAHDVILWSDKAGKATWLWYLYENDDKEIRLITRLRTQYDWKSLWIIYYLIFDMGDIVMMKKCMKGIKQRAEQM